MQQHALGEIQDHEAARQLGLGEDYKIFMIGRSVDYIDDLDARIGKLGDDAGLLWEDDVRDTLLNSIQEVALPEGFVMVGMSPVTGGGPKKYGVVKIDAGSAEHLS